MYDALSLFIGVDLWGGAKGAIAHPVSYGYGLDNQIKPSFEDKLNKISKPN